MRCLRPVHHDMVGICYRLHITTKCFFLTPKLLASRRLLPKLANYRSPLFLPISLVHGRQASPPLNQRKWLHRNIRHIITSLQVPRPPIPSRSIIKLCKTYAILEINFFKYTRIIDDGRFGIVVDGEYASSQKKT